MSWACDLTEDAESDLRRLPKPIQERVARALIEMSADPFQGDVKPLKGKEWRDMFRRRMGDYRILFVADHTAQHVVVIGILRRSEKTTDKAG